MAPQIAHRINVGNRLLATLSNEELDRLLAHAEIIRLPKSKIINYPGDQVLYAYFPNKGLISLLSMTESGATIEVGMVGDEGMIGLPPILGVSKTPYESMIQIPVEALKIRVDVLRNEFNRGRRLHKTLLCYTHLLITQLSQSAVCNRFHSVEKRLCRWLLVASDCVNDHTLSLTQEIISHMLGTPRTGVTMAAVELQKAGLISYNRGLIVILDRQGLEAASCECYRINKEAFECFLDE